MDLIIKNGTVVTECSTSKVDIAVKGEKIVSIAKNIKPAPSAEIIDAKGKYVIPGGIDVHTHFQLPFCGTVSADDFYTGTKAAARGGVTTIIDFATQDKKKGMLYAIKKRMDEAKKKVCVDYSLHCVIINWNDRTEAEMKMVIAFGIPTFKMFMIYEAEGWQADDAMLFQGLEVSKKYGARIMVHAESEKVMSLLIKRCLKIKGIGAYGHTLSRPNFIEEEAVQRAIKWTEVTNGRLYIVHMSTSEAADLVKKARKDKIDVVAETCPPYLLLTDDLFKDKKNGHLYATCPQIKKRKDNIRLWKALTDGEISVVATDTCTFNKKQKAMWKGNFTKIPFGLPGVEIMLPVIYTFGVLKNKFSINHFVSLVSSNPAKVMGLYPQKGTIVIGSDADISIFDPKKKKKIDYKELSTNCDWSPYQGMQLAGFPEMTISRGKIIVENGIFVGQAGYGKFLKRKVFGKV